MKKFSVAVPMGENIDPLDAEILSDVDSACARAATMWTPPQLVRVTDGTEMGADFQPAPGRKVAYYECMAQPREYVQA